MFLGGVATLDGACLSLAQIQLVSLVWSVTQVDRRTVDAWIGPWSNRQWRIPVAGKAVVSRMLLSIVN